MSTPLMTIAVLTFNGETLLDACLQSILRQWMPVPSEVLVIDNGSQQPVSLPPDGRLRLVRFETNRMNIGGTNACYAHAKAPWVLFVANDVRLHQGCIEQLWAHRSPKQVVQPVLIDGQGEIDNAGLRWHWPGYGSRIRTLDGTVPDAVANTCHLMPTSLWERVGGFDEGLGISHEDIDFCLRARRLGYRSGVVGSAVATHLMGQTIGRTISGHLSPYYHRARLKVIERHYRGWDRWSRLAAIQGLDWLSAHRPRR